ncbi:hypothetical protein CLAFUW4_11701 [Fulvia fulva]|uniref:Uncharacterized protein n=1 Tax=Passalora fulva TaxID=5499 RepID=A0A9Q8URY6_PASFU|nr:uncharacterized protein CLAFUR5_10746 [Fulvia fulva]KAK4619723.1 hypothetical protein CLAFUR4_11706 [Fulvia fulva]KAK4620720.1 hypothetical protein CLAFUR0_11719 [Fulvia fulva]UJO20216.1 hypothetical protein CLAFUR5_10746 [Fulvia fulva]WPV17498.1 hypothetical protein CLAFUW4_11701 [Fulvia fulva]WPV32067.1 hypothetical protein CLAFUW7_11709 [Fulvia fulva]
MCLGLVYAKQITDRSVPLSTVYLAMLRCLLGINIGTYTGTSSVAGPVLLAIFNDFGILYCTTVPTRRRFRSAIFTVEPKES